MPKVGRPAGGKKMSPLTDAQKALIDSDHEIINISIGWLVKKVRSRGAEERQIVVDWFHDRLVVAAHTWNPSFGYPWRNYLNGITRAWWPAVRRKILVYRKSFDLSPLNVEWEEPETVREEQDLGYTPTAEEFLARLTPRERRILMGRMSGKSLKEIAQEENMSYRNVSWHEQKARYKVGARIEKPRGKC